MKHTGPGRAHLYHACAEAGMTKAEAATHLGVVETAVHNFCARNPQVKFAPPTRIHKFGLTNEQLAGYRFLRSKGISKHEAIRIAKT